MISTARGTIVPAEAATLNDLDIAAGWVRSLEDREALRTSRTVEEARPAVARRVGTSPGTLANLRKRRVKSISTFLFRRLRGALIAELENEARRLEHELALLRPAGLDRSDREMAAVVADLSTVRSALGLPQ